MCIVNVISRMQVSIAQTLTKSCYYIMCTKLLGIVSVEQARPSLINNSDDGSTYRLIDSSALQINQHVVDCFTGYGKWQDLWLMAMLPPPVAPVPLCIKYIQFNLKPSHL